MNLVFVDTGAWLAIAVKRDQYHKRAAAYYQHLSSQNVRLLTTNYALVETYTRIRYDDGHAKAVSFREILSRAVEQDKLFVEWITPELHEEAWSIFQSYSDQEFSIVDCASFVVAQRARVDEVFGFDKGFITMGFNLRPPR